MNQFLIESFESRQFCSAVPGWSICGSFGLPFAGASFCVGPQGVSGGLQASPTPYPVFVEGGYSMDWQGNPSLYTSAGVQGGLGFAWSGSVTSATDRFGGNTISGSIGDGIGVQDGTLGFALTYQANLTSNPFSW